MAETRAARLRFMVTLSALLGFGSISTDIYLPALPTISRALRAPAGVMELSISGYLVGFSLGQLAWGPIGDRYGRRLPTAAGIVLFMIGSAGCALAATPWQLIGWRILQALGACAGVVLARAMVRDLYDRDRAAHMLSTLIIIMAMAPLAGPLVGGQVLALASWRAIFWVLVGVGAMALAAVLALPETLPHARRSSASALEAIRGYAFLLRQRPILGYASVGAFHYLGTFAYIAGTPFVFITYYHVPPQLYGLLFASTIVGVMAMNMLNRRLVARMGSDRLLSIGADGAAGAGLLVALVTWTGWGGLAALVIALLLFFAMVGLIIANSIAGALARYPEKAGTVSALVGAIHYSAGIVGSAMIGMFADGTPWTLGWVTAFAGLGCIASMRFFLPRRDAA